MTATIKNIAAFTVALIIGAVSLAKGGIEFQSLSLEKALAKAQSENKNLFIDVYATWCGPCKYLSNNVFTDEDLGDFMNDNFICLKLDGEKPDGRSLMIDFDLDSYPTMLFLSPEKKMLKKIVGAEGPEAIQSKAQGVLNPESTAIYQLTKRYEAGERDRKFLGELLTESLAEGRDHEALVEEYIKLYPDLDLEDDADFAVFVLGIDERDHPLTKEFLRDAEQLNIYHPSLAETKMGAIVEQLVEEAQEKKDVEYLKSEMSKMYDAYESIFGDYAFEEPQLIEILETMYNDGLD